MTVGIIVDKTKAFIEDKLPQLALWDNGIDSKRILMIEKSGYKKLEGDAKERIYFSGRLYEIAKTPDPDLPFVPKYSTTIINVPIENIMSLERILEG